MPAPDELNQTNRAEDFAEQPDSGDEPAALRHARDFEIKNALQPDHHAQTGEDLRVVLQRHPRKTKHPLGIVSRIQAPGDVVGSRQTKHGAMKAAAWDHGGAGHTEKAMETWAPGAVD